ncbi:MAG TPA: hypothetical protein VFO76_11755 [Candidatus Kapabacteria bacterium]|nr:hypothetical protein [Candidatus Kapabacteria bacterium]
MKRTVIFYSMIAVLFGIIGNFKAMAQPAVNITTQLSMPPNPSPYLSDWQSNPQSIILTANLAQPYNQPVKLMAQLTLNGQVVAKTNPQKMKLLSLHQGMNSFIAIDLVPYSAIDFTGSIDQSVQRSGMLPEGNYQICIWFVDGETPREIGGSACNPFTIRDIQPPTLLSPANGAVFQGSQLRTSTDRFKHATQLTLAQLASTDPGELKNMSSIDLTVGGNHFLYTIDPKFTERDTAEAMQIPVMAIRPGTNTNTLSTAATCSCGCGGTAQPRCATKECGCSKTKTAASTHYELNDVLISSTTISGQGAGDPVPTESISLNFSWLPPMPVPATPIRYQLRIVPIYPGQTAQQAFQSSQPIIVREISSTSWLPDNLTIFGHEAKSFAWGVQAINSLGNAIGKNNGWSEIRVFDLIDSVPPTPNSFFDVFQTVDLPTAGMVRLNTTPEPCPYKFKKLKRSFYTPCKNGMRSKYQVWGIFTCSLNKGHSGPHHGTMDDYYVLVGSIGCEDDNSGTGSTPIEPLPEGARIIKKDSLDKIPNREEADKNDVGAGGVKKEPCPYVEKTLLRTVAGSWKRGKTTVRHISYHRTTVAWADVTWSRDIWNVYLVKHCILEKNHAGPHKLDAGKEEFEKYGTITETVTYGVGVPQVPPKSAADNLPQEDPH